MRLFDIPGDATEQAAVEAALRGCVEDWVGLLAKQDYAGALELILHEVPKGAQWPGKGDWSPRQLENNIAFHGLLEDPGDLDFHYKVVPLAGSLLGEFRRAMTVWFETGREFGVTYLGSVHADLPLNYPQGDAVGDLTARFFLRQIGVRRMALVLLDVHVM